MLKRIGLITIICVLASFTYANADLGKVLDKVYMKTACKIFKTVMRKDIGMFHHQLEDWNELRNVLLKAKVSGEDLFDLYLYELARHGFNGDVTFYPPDGPYTLGRFTVKLIGSQSGKILVYRVYSIIPGKGDI